MTTESGQRRRWVIALWVPWVLAGCTVAPLPAPAAPPPGPVAQSPNPAAPPPSHGAPSRGPVAPLPTPPSPPAASQAGDVIGLIQRSGDLVLQRDPLRTEPTTYGDLGYVCLALLRAAGNLDSLDAERARRLRSYGLGVAEHLVRDRDMNHDGRTGWGLDTPYRDQASGVTIPAHQEYAFQTGVVGYCLLEAYEQTREARYLNTVRDGVATFWSQVTIGIDPRCRNCAYFWYSTHPFYAGWLVKNTNVLMGMVVARLARLTGDAAYRERAQQVFNSERYELEVRRNFDYFGFNDRRHRPNQEKHLAPEMWAFDELAHQLGEEHHAIAALAEAYWACGERCGANIAQVPGILAGCTAAHHGEPSRTHCRESIAHFSAPAAKVDSVALLGVMRALPMFGLGATATP